MVKNYIKKARQPEVIRTIQKDLQYTNELNQDVLEVAQFLAKNNRNFMRFSDLIKIISNIAYHGFGAVNRLQTLGEEYTGVIQIDTSTDHLPKKLIQVVAVIFEFGGESFLIKILNEYERRVNESEELVPEARRAIAKLISIVKSSLPYVKALHRGLFFLNNSGQLQISKWITGIQYVLTRFWLNDHHNIGAYKILGAVTIMQVIFSLLLKVKEKREQKRLQAVEEETRESRSSRSQLTRPLRNVGKEEEDEEAKKCILCLEDRVDLSSTQCGHLFCWTCICDWLKYKSECPICREHLTQSSVIFLQNYC